MLHIRAIARTIESGKVLPNRQEMGGVSRTVHTVVNKGAVLDAVAEAFSQKQFNLGNSQST